MASIEAVAALIILGSIIGVLSLVGLGIFLSSRFSRAPAQEHAPQEAAMRHHDMERWVASIDASVPPLEQPSACSLSGTPPCCGTPRPEERSRSQVSLPDLRNLSRNDVTLGQDLHRSAWPSPMHHGNGHRDGH